MRTCTDVDADTDRENKMEMCEIVWGNTTRQRDIEGKAEEKRERERGRGVETKRMCCREKQSSGGISSDTRTSTSCMLAGLPAHPTTAVVKAMGKYCI
jgi:hypothetical protein